MTNNLRRGVGILAGIFLLDSAHLLSAQTKPAASRVAQSSAAPEKVVQYIRERFGIPDTTKMTADPFRDSAFPGFDQSTVTVDDGKQKKTQSVFVSKDGLYLILGNLFTLSGNSEPKAEIAQRVREFHKLPATTELTVSSPGKFIYSPFSQITVAANDGKRSQSQVFYVTRNNRMLVIGNIYALMGDPRGEILRAISTEDQPSVGPARAPVTIVEYADLQCPSCARMHEFLEKDLLPKYGDKVRVIFKEFPLASVHDWAMTAAIASQCAYQIDPGAFAAYRSLIFRNQGAINATNARDMLLTLAAQAGIDSLKLAACVDSKASVSRVERSLQEGQTLNIGSTPTFFINGKVLVGVPAPNAFYKAVDEALHRTKWAGSG